MTARKGNAESVHGLSPMQEGILFHTIHAPGTGLYVEQYTCEMEGALDLAQWERAWHHVVHRHGALRTLFTWERRERPLQIVRREVVIPWRNEDWRELSPSRREEAFAELLRSDRLRGFDLESAPLLRITLVRTSESSYRFLFTFHHLLLDGWSLRLVLQEAFDSYRALVQGKPLTDAPERPYRDHLAWLESRSLERAQTYWTRILAGVESPTRLGIESSRASWAVASDEIEIPFSEKETGSLQDFARAHRLTLNTVLRGAWGAILSRYSGESDVVFGATVSGRPPDLDGVERMVGLFINTVPVRVHVAAEDRVVPWLQSILRDQMEASEFDFAPLARVQRWSEVRGEPLLHSLLVFQNVPSESAETGPIAIRRERYLEQSNFPLALLAFPGPQLLLRLVYDRDRYSRESMELLAEHLRTMMLAFRDHSEERVEALVLRSVADRSSSDVDASALELPAETRMHHWIMRAVQRAPDATAIVDADRTCSYRQLHERSLALSRRIRRHGVQPGQPVAIALDRSFEMIVGILGILEADAAYVPIDPEQPIERTRSVIDEIASPVIVTTRARAATMAPLSARLVLVDEHSDGVGAPDGDEHALNEPYVVVPGSVNHGFDGLDVGVRNVDEPGKGTRDTLGDDHSDRAHFCLTDSGRDPLAYVIYTSGSTGVPKGVEITHGNLIYSTVARQHHYKEPVGRFCLTSPFVFDSSVAGIFWTLVDGGTLVLPPPRMEQDVLGLAELIATHAVTHILTLPSLYALLLELAPAESLQSLRTVIVAGEACPPDVPERHFRTLPRARLHNEYGPTEATVWSTVHDFSTEARERVIPIGRPIAGTQIRVLDRLGRDVPLGAPGELYLGGRGIARGYFHRPELTQERFVRLDRETGRVYRTGDRVRLRRDGTLEFLGRTDDQVKVRGHRIELGEIESAIRRQPEVRDAAVVSSEAASPVDVLLLDRLRELDEATALQLLTDVESLTDEEAEELLRGR